MLLGVLLFSGLFYLIPGTIEMLCHSAESVGNMRTSNIYYDIQYKRNFVYITAFSSIFFSHTNMYVLRYFFYSLFLFSNYSYYNTIKKWYPYLS